MLRALHWAFIIQNSAFSIQHFFLGVIMRTGEIKRKTNETDIALKLEVDGQGRFGGQTGVAFLDHMLALFAAHGLFDLTVTAAGDLQVDEHHTVEDIGICLGKALDQALGDRQGLVRTASSFVPMDEALGFVAIDLGGRPYCVVDAAWHTPRVGQMGTDLIYHFFESVATHGRLNLHAKCSTVATIIIRSRRCSKPLAVRSMRRRSLTRGATGCLRPRGR